MGTREKNENSFLIHGGILAIASMLVRFIGMIYRIPMVNIIGSEGNGYYSTAYSVYNILLLLSSYSLPLAVSKMVSAKTVKGEWKETKRIFYVALAFSLAVGIVFGLICFFGADAFCTAIMKNPMASVGLKFMAPTILIMAVLGVFRGFFQGLQTTIPTAVSQIIEQIVNAIFSVGMAAVLFRYGAGLDLDAGTSVNAPAWGAAGGTIGTGAGALTALIFVIVIFMMYRRVLNRNARRDKTLRVASYPALSVTLVSIAVPVILSTAAYNCIDLIDVALFNNYMSSAGYTQAEYVAVMGDYNSAYLLLVHLPVAIASAIAQAMVPSLTSAYVKKDQALVLQKVGLTVRTTLLISIPFSFGMMAVGGNLAKLLFPGIANDAMRYLVVGGLAVITYSLSSVTNGVLQGLDEMRKPVRHALFSLGIHLVLMMLMLFVFKMEIYAVIVSYVLFGVTMSAMNLYSIYKKIGYLPDIIKAVLIPCTAAFIMALVCVFVSGIFGNFLTGRVYYLVTVLVSFILGVVIYAVLILRGGCLTRRQLFQLPMGSKIVSVADKLHLLSK